MAPEAEDIVVQMIRRCGDQFRVVRHKRNTRLTLQDEPYVLGRDLKKGDALIVVSPRSPCWRWRPTWRTRESRCSVIYGNLPPATRREQVRRFLSKETDVVVSTDAIGMGLNLPIRRIVFVETRKFDGVNKRTLNPEEIKQIAGRAGRFGLYDEGFVAAIDDVDVIADGLSRLPLPIMKAYVGFPEQLLSLRRRSIRWSRYGPEWTRPPSMRRWRWTSFWRCTRTLWTCILTTWRSSPSRRFTS